MATQIKPMSLLGSTGVVTERDEENEPIKKAWFLFESAAPGASLSGGGRRWSGGLIGFEEFEDENGEKNIPPDYYLNKDSRRHWVEGKGTKSVRETKIGSVTSDPVSDDDKPPYNGLFTTIYTDSVRTVTTTVVGDGEEYGTTKTINESWTTNRETGEIDKTESEKTTGSQRLAMGSENVQIEETTESASTSYQYKRTVISDYREIEYSSSIKQRYTFRWSRGGAYGSAWDWEADPVDPNPIQKATYVPATGVKHSYEVDITLSDPDTEEDAIARSDHPDGEEANYTVSDYPYRTGRTFTYTQAKVAFQCRNLYPGHRYVLQYDIEEYIYKNPADAASEAEEKEDMDAEAAAAYDQEIAERDAEAGIGVWKHYQTEKRPFTAPEREEDEDGNWTHLVEHIEGGTEEEDEDGNPTIKAQIALPFEKGKAYRTANVVIYPEYARILDVPEPEPEEA